MKMYVKAAGLVLLAGFVVTGIVLLGACKGAGEKGRQEMAENMVEKMLEKQTGKKAKIDFEKGKVKIETPEGTAEISESGEWPGDLPGEVPAFKLGVVKGVWKSDSAEQKGWNIVVESLEKDAMAKYVDALKSSGWKILSTFSSGEGSGTFAASREGGLNLVGTFNAEEKAGSISVVLKPEENQE